jgi:hypothetical protein
MTLRLLHLPESSPKLQPVRDGLISYVSPENEAAAIRSLAEVCRRVQQACSEGLTELGKLQGEERNEARKGAGNEDGVGDLDGGDGGGALIGVVSTIKGLWEEEKALATAVAVRVERGDTDW